MTAALASVTPELAKAAAATAGMTALRALTDWIGDGKPVTESRLLPDSLVPEICTLLSIDPSKANSDDDDEAYEGEYGIEPLDTLWEMAEDIGLIAIGSSRVRAKAVPDPDADPEGVLRVWMDTALCSFDLLDEPLCAQCLSALVLLADTDEPQHMVPLLETVAGDFDHDETERTVSHVVPALRDMAQLGILTVCPPEEPVRAEVELTQLGRMLTATVLAELTLAADAATDAVVARLGTVTPRIAIQISGPWLAARSAEEAVAEVLDYAAYARADMRMVAAGFASTLGDQAAPAWKERVRDPGVGVYARGWLAEHGYPVQRDPRDEAWLEVEKFSARLASIPPELAFLAYRDLFGGEGHSALHASLATSRHPDALRLSEAINEATGRPVPWQLERAAAAASAATGTAHRIRVTLRGVGDPAVWRQIAVDAGTSLSDLHRVIQAAMGWEDDHQHSFVHGRQQLDERIAIGQVCRRVGSRLLYTYDFGDNWEHDVVVEAAGVDAEGLALPALLAGGGACPPEDCGGVPGYARLKRVMADPDDPEHDEMAEWLGQEYSDAAAFSLAKASAAVARCPSPRPARPAATVIRTQPRAKDIRKKRRR